MVPPTSRRVLVGVASAALLVGGLAALGPGTASADAPTLPSNYTCPTVTSPAQAGQTKIMIAGDSITNASSGDYTWRYRFWHDQVDQGANINLVGSFTDTIDAVSGAQGSHQFNDCNFDQDEEARPGAKLFAATNQSGDPLANAWNFTSPTPANSSAYGPYFPNYPGASSWIAGAVTMFTPDVVIAFAGANDLYRIHEEDPQYDKVTPESAANNNAIATIVFDRIHTFVHDVQAADPNSDVVLTTVPVPSGGNALRYSAYNKDLSDVVAAHTWDTTTSKVVLANLPDWSAEGHSWDGVHPDAVGEVEIAAAMDDAVHQLTNLTSMLPARPATLAQPEIGPVFPAVLKLPTFSSSAVNLSWTLPPGSDRTQVWLKDTTVAGSQFTLKADLAPSDLAGYIPGSTPIDPPPTTFKIPGLVGGDTYEFYLVSAKGFALAPTIQSNHESLMVPVTPPPAKVATIHTAAGVHSVSLAWSAVANATSYKVTWQRTGSAVASATVTGASRAVTGLIAGTPYKFTVTGIGPSGTGPVSASVSATPKAFALAAPAKPTIKLRAGHKFTATWKAVTHATRYLVQLRTASGSWKTIEYTTAKSYTSKKLVKGRKYAIRIRPYDSSVGGSPYSAAATLKMK
jgi:lysophospholipase L1-like esterase